MRRLVLFAHYDAQGQVKPFIVQYLKALRELCDEIVFVSTAKLPESEQEKARAYCSQVILRDNVGYDFGMWRDAIERLDFSEWDELVLTNSSVFGPVFPLAPIFDEMSKTRCEAWGMTDNVEIAWHLQSYFLVFRKEILRSPIFRAFWSSVLPYKDKDQVIRSYEVGLSRLLLDHGFRLRAYVPLATLPMPKSMPSIGLLPDFDLWSRILTRRANPTCAYPVALLRAGMPFVKAELLRDNPLLADLPPVLSSMTDSGYDMSLLEFDRPLKRHGTPAPVLERLREAHKNGAAHANGERVRKAGLREESRS